MWQAKRTLKIFFKDTVSFFVYIVLCIVSRRGLRATLVYHSIGKTLPEKDPQRMHIDPDDFRSHLRYIARSKEEIEITFDDGFKNVFKHAYPLLKEYGLTATFFLTTHFIDGVIDSRKIWNIEKIMRPLSWGELKEMALSGMKIGSHGRSHANLAGLAPSEAEEEIAGSKKRIEERLGIPVTEFSYPIGAHGAFNNTTGAIVSRCGYERAYTNVMGLNGRPDDDIYALKRIRVNTEDGVFRLRMKIKGAYNWVDWFTQWK
jgi:peptidoglycan/xylan/chitin deacetylase (PgdA/CDA1 family)